MGLFEFFISVSDFWKKKKPTKKIQYPFTTTNSFRLFTCAQYNLVALQHGDVEAVQIKLGPSPNNP